MSNKCFSEKWFDFGDRVSVHCRAENTRYGFRHLATLRVDYVEIANAKACYYNRTWESFEFESVLLRLADKAAPEIKAIILAGTKQAEAEDRRRVDQMMGTIGAIAALGDLMTDNQAEANDWKARMLKAGLGGAGLEMPEDWDTLPEDEKQRRLDAAIRYATGTPTETITPPASVQA